MGEAVESGAGDDDEPKTTYRSDNIGNATRLIDVFRNAIGIKQVTAGSKEISAMVEKLYRFQTTALCSMDDLRAMIVPESGERTLSVLGRLFSGSEIPRQDQLRHIKAQQKSLSRERERMIQGIQGQPDVDMTAHSAAVYSALHGFGEQNIDVTAEDSEALARDAESSMGIRFGMSTSFSEAGRQLAETFTLNRRQSIALRLICR